LMGDHLALIVDRLLIESTLEAAIGGGKHMVDLCQETMDVEYFHRGLGGGSVTKVVECRICQEEDWDTCMEAPCTCCGSLKRSRMATEICSFLWKNNFLSVLVLLLYPFLWVWTVIGTLWFSTARGCLPEEGQKWGFLIWLLFSYCGFACIACLAIGK
ncbi:hypothetical protein ACJX0J_034085, partial [Zea mays]